MASPGLLDGVLDENTGWVHDLVPDLDEDFVQNEDNLALFGFDIDTLPPDGMYELRIAKGYPKVDLWSSATKGTRIFDSTNVERWFMAFPSQTADFQSIVDLWWNFFYPVTQWGHGFQGGYPWVTTLNSVEVIEPNIGPMIW